ncbi:WecB/TagA/CpsF family glycosyltransferase [Aeromicrobium wangtongii]|uniref:WecB/TagA/CpsF family glycosyltransferase n=1 Tax=Aeromicrobium wangtongii TaxID=2969247 RepID=UPI00201737A2|nr:WecB/TagA/CpsF family glycosyltransferase [Aeromicrobium wangtongii]MCL3819110.1 WecB/TagA/CpsF family glycosyltransferase [Aeromicrobium wangtongii]
MITEELIDQMARKCLVNDDALDAAVLDHGSKRIQTVNLHHLALASRSAEFARTIERADYITADGWPIVSLMRSRGIDPARVTGSEFIERMLAGRQFHGVKAAILGASRDAGFDFRGQLHDSGLHVVFRDHGSRRDWKPKRVAKKLRKYGVQLLIIAVTPPFGDMIGEEIRLAGFDGVVVNVGGAVDMFAGDTSLAPEWVRAAKMEWFYRLALEPRRLFRRYFVECLPVFVKYVLPQVWRAERVPQQLPASRPRQALTDGRAA